MVVTALYRRYRPETFAELIGQTQVTDPLRTALRTDRVNHAYLFSGPRGCGKTTSARILARCLNCAKGPTDTPCGECASCVELARDGGGSLDVVEIDAASHNGVDDARDLRERAAFAPARDRYKIFILDEAHMVTSQGFNALLKIVEEPPEHVKFIFATTEPEKVIGTIRSRTHHYPFRLVPPAQMLEYVQQLCESEHVEVQPGVLPLVVRAGGGSVRDTLSLLDQLIAGSEDGAVAYERAVALLGYTPAALLDEVIEAIGAREAPTAFGAIDRVIQTGQDPRRFVEDLLERLRDLIVVAAVRDNAASVLRGVPQDELDRMAHQATAFGAAELSRAADIANTALTEMTGATSPRLHLELLVARLLVPSFTEGERGAIARVERLERRVGIEGATDAGAGSSTSAAPAAAPAAAAPPAPAARAAEPTTAPASAVAEPPAAKPAAERATRPEAPAEVGPVSLQQVRDAWPEVLDVVKRRGRSAWMVVFTSQARELVGDVLTLSFPGERDVDGFRQPQAGADSASEHLRAAIVEVLGIRVKFLARVEAGAAATPATPPAEPAVPAVEQAVAAPEPDSAPTPDASPAVQKDASGWAVAAIPAAEPDEPESTTPAPPARGRKAQTAKPTSTNAKPAADPAPDPAPAEPEPPAAPPRNRYGEAVVRELLGASFIEEVAVAPRVVPVAEPAPASASTGSPTADAPAGPSDADEPTPEEDR